MRFASKPLCDQVEKQRYDVAAEIEGPSRHILAIFIWPNTAESHDQWEVVIRNAISCLVKC